MKLLDKVQEIINQHELKPLVFPDGITNVYTFLSCYPEFKKDFESDKDDTYFIKKWSSHIPKGWYGFSIGTPIVPIWCDIIDNILEICFDADSNFEIYQIKIKFGGIRFYCHSEVIEDLFDVERLIEKTLYDRALIY